MYIHSKTSNKVLKVINDKVKRTVILVLEICSIVLVFLFLMHPPAVGSTGSFFSKLMSTDLSGSTLHSPEAISQVSSLS